MRLGVVDQLDRRPRLWAAVAVALTLAAAPLLMSLGVDNSIEGWIDRDSEAFSAYQEFLDAFGSEEYILVIYSLPADFDLAFLERLTDLRWTLEEISGVRGVRCLSEIYSRGFGLLGIEAFRRDLLESPFYRDFMVSADRGSGEGHRAAMWVELEGRELRDSTAIVAQVEAATREAAPGEEIYLAGSPIIDQALDEGSRRASRTFFPLVFLLSAALLLCFFPHPYGVLIPFCSVGAGIVWILGLMALSGSSLNMVTVALPPLLWVLGLSTSIHLLSRCRQLLAAGAELDEAIPRAMGELARPCCSSAITTALGFGSLIASSMQPVREMGLFASLGILLGLSSNFLLFPCLARLFPPLPAESSANHHPVLAALGLFIERRPRTIAILAGVMGLTIGVALLGLRADSNVISFFKSDSKVAVTYQQVLADFTGPYSVEVLLTPPGEVAALEVFRQVDHWIEAIAARPEVAKVISAVDLVKKAHQRAAQAGPEVHVLPLDEVAFDEAWQDVSGSLAEELAGFYRQPDTLRLSVLARPTGSSEHRELLQAIDGEFAKLGVDWRSRVTGIVPLLVDMQEQLVESQIRSFGLAFLLIGPVIALLLRSARFALLSLAPNLMPIVVALGVMSLFDIALDPATVMIAGIALGIGVDDTIHLLEYYLCRRREGMAAGEAVGISLQTVGRAMIRTSVVAALGFFALCFSEFLPLLYFGIFTSLAMLVALGASLIVLPALLLWADTANSAE